MTAMEKSSNIHQTRAMVQWAFSEKEGVRGSIFEVFSGRRTKKSGLLAPSRTLDGLSPTRVHAVETQKGGQSRIPIASGRSGGQIRSLVYQLDPIEQHWIHHIYNPNPVKKTEAHRALRPALWERYLSLTDLKGARTRTIVLATFMVRLQLEQATTFSEFQKWSASRPKQLADSISRSSWSDTHVERWLEIRRMLERLDADALTSLYVKNQHAHIELAVQNVQDKDSN